MELFKRIFLAAVLAGGLAGVAMSVVQQWRVAPLILEAELYETGDGHDHDHDHGDVHSDAALTPEADTQAEEEVAWAPADGFERMFYTVSANILVAVGFALIMNAVAVLVKMDVSIANGLVWGAGGFAVFSLAPGFGLPPELPGMAAADLVARQIWWWTAVLATAGGLILMARYRTGLAIAAGVALIVLPQLIGAPQPPEASSDVPPHLASAFASATVVTSAVYWISAGVLLGWFNRYFKGEAVT